MPSSAWRTLKFPATVSPIRLLFMQKQNLGFDKLTENIAFTLQKMSEAKQHPCKDKAETMCKNLKIIITLGYHDEFFIFYLRNRSYSLFANIPAVCKKHSYHFPALVAQKTKDGSTNVKKIENATKV